MLGAYDALGAFAKLRKATVNFRAAVSNLNSVLWDRDVTCKTKTNIYHAIVKNTITYATETWCLKAKTIAKLNSTKNELLATLSEHF
jgi:hypothetical protein